MKTLFANLLISLFLCGSTAQSKIHVVFRYDDYSPDIPDQRSVEPARQKIWNTEQEMDRVFRKHNAPYHLSIIPVRSSEKLGRDIQFTEDHEKIELVNRGICDNLIEVSQHGYKHVNNAKKGRRRGEFRDRSYPEQRHDVATGKHILEDALKTSIEIFVPPFNGWNSDTGRVLTELGFKILSADQYYVYDTVKALKLIPYTSLLNDLEAQDLTRLPHDCVVTVLFHPVELIEDATGGQHGYFKPFSLERLDRLLLKLKSDQNIEVTTFARLTEDYTLGYDQYRQSSRDGVYRKLMASLLPGLVSSLRRDYYSLLPDRGILNWPFLLWQMVVMVAAPLGGGIGFLLRKRVKAKTAGLIPGLSTLGAMILAAKLAELNYRGFNWTAEYILALALVGGIALGSIKYGCFVKLCAKGLNHRNRSV